MRTDSYCVTNSTLGYETVMFLPQQASCVCLSYSAPSATSIYCQKNGPVTEEGNDTLTGKKKQTYSKGVRPVFEMCHDCQAYLKV